MIRRFKAQHAWLSNFYLCQVALDGLPFPSVEHAYQAAKVLSPEIRERIRAMPTAADAKRFGMRIGRSIAFRPAWTDEFKVQTMRYLLRQKFTCSDLCQRLMSTGDEELVEMNYWHDRVWGCCSCAKCGGKGQNWLGRLLMEMRQECRITYGASELVGSEDMADAA